MAIGTLRVEWRTQLSSFAITPGLRDKEILVAWMQKLCIIMCDVL